MLSEQETMQTSTKGVAIDVSVFRGKNNFLKKFKGQTIRSL